MAVTVLLPAALYLGIGATWITTQALDVPVEPQGTYLTLAAMSSLVLWAYSVNATRAWLQGLRSRWLRKHGTATIATLTAFDHSWLLGARGLSLSVYTLEVTWTVDGQVRTGQRTYRFLIDPGDRSARRDEFLTRLDTPDGIPLLHPRGRPHRFLLDLPFAPRMSDHFL